MDVINGIVRFQKPEHGQVIHDDTFFIKNDETTLMKLLHLLDFEMHL